MRALLLCFLLLGACTTLPPATESRPPQGLGSPKQDGGHFLARHESFLQRGRQGPVGLLFIGDSITEGWARHAADIWSERYAAFQAANFGIGGDRIDHVLWRLDNGELETIRPRVIVLMIGTNDSASRSGSQIAAGVRQILSLIRSRQPQARILLLAILPRGPRPGAARDDSAQRMQAIREANAELARLDDGDQTRFLDLGGRFLQDGRIPPELMPDQLHPSRKGYQIWAEAMQPLLDEMLAHR
ncbi:GDSL-type esterase/lipase family protein [Uliginosibacterium paludis]|uniref:GDSL-type esterase/lipase family protein n=1 Tax=Uliginosibacterium paludis TaxID=1615952 RepID=A0ABV2CMH5_9RHOO